MNGRTRFLAAVSYPMNLPSESKPNASPCRRSTRLARLALVVLGLGLLSVWDPLTAPGPTCCWFRHAVGLPCPLCGLTRGVALCLRGRLLEGSTFNPLAVPFLFIVVPLLSAKWAAEYATRREIALRRPGLRRLIGGLAAVAVLASWVYLLTCRREDDFAGSWLGRLLHLLSF